MREPNAAERLIQRIVGEGTYGTEFWRDWPPHRPQGTPPRQRRGRYGRKKMIRVRK